MEQHARRLEGEDYFKQDEALRGVRSLHRKQTSSPLDLNIKTQAEYLSIILFSY